MIALLVLLIGSAVAIYGKLCLSQNPIESKAEGALMLVIGCVIAFIGLCLAVLT